MMQSVMLLEYARKSEIPTCFLNIGLLVVKLDVILKLWQEKKYCLVALNNIQFMNEP